MEFHFYHKLIKVGLEWEFIFSSSLIWLIYILLGWLRVPNCALVTVEFYFFYFLWEMWGILQVSQAPITPTGKTSRTQFFIYIYIIPFLVLSLLFVWPIFWLFSLFSWIILTLNNICCLCATPISLWVKFSMLRRDNRV